MINYDALEKIRGRWSREDADGECLAIAENVVNACGGSLLQYYSELNGMSGYHDNYVDFFNSGAESICTPFCGNWKNEYVFHAVALIDDNVVDLFYPDPTADISETIIPLAEYKNIVQSHNTQGIVFYEN